MKVNHQRLEDVPPDGLEGAGRRPATYFAPAVRATADELAADLNAITSHPILGGLLQSVSGLLAVLNDKRQLISVNTNFLQALGINDINDILALRPGEAVGCIHAYEPPNGCGTTRFCATCGAAIAIVTSLAKNLPVEETCALTVGRGGKPVEMCLSVRAHPVTNDNRRLLLLFLLDITKEHFLQSLERIFFHDVNNILNGIMGYCQLYCQSHDHPPEIEKVSELANRLCQTVALQRALSSCGESKLTPQWQTIASEQVVSEVMAVFVHHPAAAGKSLVADNRASGQTIGSDITLLLRVLCNMVTNALEASPPKDQVRLTVEVTPKGGLSFSVWNQTVIPEQVQPRIFQQHFSTKEGPGRGFGTYSMKLFGEQYLGGEVCFSSSETEGTTFRLVL